MKTFFIETKDENGFIVIAPDLETALAYVKNQNSSGIRDNRELTQPQIWHLGKME